VCNCTPAVADFNVREITSAAELMLLCLFIQKTMQPPGAEVDDR